MSTMRALWLVGLSWVGCAGGADAPPWEPVADLERHGWLVSATASPDGNAWFAVGGEPEQGVVLREQGELWMPEPIPGVPLLNWAQVFADGQILTVGNGGTVLHFDGQVWQRQESSTTEDLWGVWGATPNDAWAVGGRGQMEGQATLLHYDGQVWSAVALPALERPQVWAFYKVWGSSAQDVYAVGQRGAALHFDGQRWSELGLGTGDDLVALWGLGPDRIAVVGGRSNGFVATFDGVRWSGKQVVPLPGLNGVWMGDPHTIYVGGIDGTLAEVDFETLAFTPQYQSPALTFHALHGAGTRVLAVGGNLGAGEPPYLGLARERTREAP